MRDDRTPEQRLQAIKDKCQQFWNVAGMCDEEIHAILENIWRLAHYTNLQVGELRRQFATMKCEARRGCCAEAEWLIGTARVACCNAHHEKWLLQFKYRHLQDENLEVTRISNREPGMKKRGSRRPD